MSDQIKELVNFDKVTRIELIEDGKRRFVTWTAKNVQLSLQDSNRTLKVFFIEEKPLH